MVMYDTRGRARAIYDPLLTNISVGWGVANQQVGDVLFPQVRVTRQSGRYQVFGREAFQPAIDGTSRAPGASANEIEGVRPSDDTFFATEHALKQLVTDEEVELYGGDPLNPRNDATENVTEKVILGRELDIHRLVTDPDTYAATNVHTLGTGEHFDEHGTSDPIALFRDVLRTYHRTLRTVPNVAIIPFQIMSYLEDHPKIVSRYVAQGGVMTAEMIASLLGLQRVYVPGGGYNSSGNPARPDSISYLWENEIVLAYVPDRPSQKTPAFGYEFVWPIKGQIRAIDRWRDEDHVGEYVRARQRYDLKITAKDDDNKSIAGVLIQNVLSSAALA